MVKLRNIIVPVIVIPGVLMIISVLILGFGRGDSLGNIFTWCIPGISLVIVGEIVSRILPK